ncbi:MAG: type IV secretory system conjugative DNA transfer family protein [Peptococcaceae bacterium]|nr:type IV secretory system conjugative DNA transfer family protein [Peptococcaceae bacterium]
MFLKLNTRKILTAMAVIFVALVLAWWAWPFLTVLGLACLVWRRTGSLWRAAAVGLFVAGALVADVALVGYGAAWAAKMLAFNALFPKAAPIRAVEPAYYLAHPLAVLRAWSYNWQGLEFPFVRDVFLSVNLFGPMMVYLVWHLYLGGAYSGVARKDTHGPARWAGKADMARVCDFGFGPGIVLGALGIPGSSIANGVSPPWGATGGGVVRIPSKLKVWMNKHVLVVGTPGSGKSRAYVRPNILSAVAEGISVLVTDPKGDIFECLGAWLRSKGYVVRVLNLVEMHLSNKWNPLDEIRQVLDADVFAEVVISSTETGAQKSGDGFWNRAEQNLLKALVLYVCYDGGGRRRPGTVGEIYDLVASGDKAALDDRFKSLPRSHPAYGPYMISKMAGENMWGNIVIGLGTRLQTFQQEEVRRITGSTEIDLEEPGKSPCAYFMISPDTHGAFNFIPSLFFTFLFVRLVSLADSDKQSKRLKVSVRALLDEFANIVVIPEFEKKIATVRSRGIECHVIVQGLPQLVHKYGRTWEEILSCCDTKLILGVKDNHTAEYVSRLIGRATVETQSESYGPDGDRRVTRGSIGRELMMLSEIANTRARTCLAFLPDGTPPARLRTVDYSEFPEAWELGVDSRDPGGGRLDEEWSLDTEVAAAAWVEPAVGGAETGHGTNCRPGAKTWASAPAPLETTGAGKDGDDGGGW